VNFRLVVTYLQFPSQVCSFLSLCNAPKHRVHDKLAPLAQAVSLQRMTKLKLLTVEEMTLLVNSVFLLGSFILVLVFV